MNVPDWMVTSWFWLSVVFFLLSIVLMVGYIALGILVFRFIKELKPKVDALEQNVQGVIQRVQVVTERVEEVATSLKSTVDDVGVKAKSVAGSADIVAQVAGQQFERFSPILVGTLTAIKVLGAIRESRKNKAKQAEQKEAAKGSGLSIGKVLGALLRLATK